MPDQRRLKNWILKAPKRRTREARSGLQRAKAALHRAPFVLDRNGLAVGYNAPNKHCSVTARPEKA
ncbi:hypothetical protein TIFTF001_030752 [Ficus carica]|uniref:Uncharacterized protein n=1 Tax=Ficus carica TaxID=3494 RepID=A0AA88DUU8_FICCA|nr:hypothetical protein TIFTF001_030752 [Ficus carica]